MTVEIWWKCKEHLIACINSTVRWRWEVETRCTCGEVEDKSHVLMECKGQRREVEKGEGRGEMKTSLKEFKGFGNMTEAQGTCLEGCGECMRRK